MNRNTLKITISKKKQQTIEKEKLQKIIKLRNNKFIKTSKFWFLNDYYWSIIIKISD